ncbi:MAG: hypothetical protein JWO31_2401, partial [Phycisphaerales bacterium]|nr:hypothetical protein [Phycisphaerales bacterium]
VYLTWGAETDPSWPYSAWLDGADAVNDFLLDYRRPDPRATGPGDTDEHGTRP